MPAVRCLPKGPAEVRCRGAAILRAWGGTVLLGTACAPTTSHAPAAAPRVPTQTDAPRRDDPCASASPKVLAACVDGERLADDLRAVVGMRPPGSLHWLAVQRHCADVLQRSGFQVALHDFGRGVNVVGVRPGLTQPESRVMVGAHYDHIPGCAGADDNASGVAGVLQLARVLGPAPTARTLVVACWDREEDGLQGSRAWVSGPMREAPAPLVYFNFDAIGFVDHRPDTQRVPAGFALLFADQVARLADNDHRADFIAVVTDASARPWAATLSRHAEVLGLPVTVLSIPEWVKDSHLVIDLQRSDHASFWDADIPAVMITDTADFRSDAYHCRRRPDDLETLDLAFVGQVVASTVYAVAVALQARWP